MGREGGCGMTFATTATTATRRPCIGVLLPKERCNGGGALQRCFATLSAGRCRALQKWSRMGDGGKSRENQGFSRGVASVAKRCKCVLQRGACALQALQHPIGVRNCNAPNLKWEETPAPCGISEPGHGRTGVTATTTVAGVARRCKRDSTLHPFTERGAQ
jgi:hypothetical protein